jgi:hypothetical protein
LSRGLSEKHDDHEEKGSGLAKCAHLREIG